MLNLSANLLLERISLLSQRNVVLKTLYKISYKNLMIRNLLNFMPFHPNKCFFFSLGDMNSKHTHIAHEHLLLSLGFPKRHIIEFIEHLKTAHTLCFVHKHSQFFFYARKNVYEFRARFCVFCLFPVFIFRIEFYLFAIECCVTCNFYNLKNKKNPKKHNRKQKFLHCLNRIASHRIQYSKRINIIYSHHNFTPFSFYI